MAGGFRSVDRDQLMLLPVDMREWLPADHLALFVIDVVDQLDLSDMERRYRLGGVGREAYHPRMMTALLIYAYCVGIRSSRQIERSCVTDVAFRVITAQQCPDHTSIARFRAGHESALTGLFGQVLGLCARAGMVKVGVVSIDGTKIAGRASSRRNYTQEYLMGLAHEVMGEAAHLDSVDDEEDDPGLPPSLGPGPDRPVRLREGLHRGDKGERVQRALARIEDDARMVISKDQARIESKLVHARRALQRERVTVEHRWAQRRHPTAHRRIPIEDQARVVKARTRVDMLEAELSEVVTGKGRDLLSRTLVANLSDPDTKPMPIHTGRSFIQGYNAQIAVSDDHLIVHTDVFRSTNDTPLFVPMMRATIDSLSIHLGPYPRIGVILADAGYLSNDALTTPGPDRLIAVGRDPATRLQPIRNQHIITMAERLKPGTRDHATYKRRPATVETVIAHLKDRIGLRQFSRRGLTAVRHELSLAATAFNILRLATHTLTA